MKRYLFAAIAVGAAILMLTGCGAAKKAQVTTSPISTFAMPGSEYVTGDGMIRGWGSGTSNNQSVARKKAQLQASTELAATLQKIVEHTIDSYTTDLEEDVASESKSLLNAKTTVTVKQALAGAVIVYDRWHENEQTGELTNYVVMELKGEDYLQSLYKEMGGSSAKIDKNLLRERFMKLIDEEGSSSKQ